MHTHSIEAWTHDHVFLGQKHDQHERRTWAVVALTAAMMVAEIVGGTMFGSMALVADGWHMSTHAAALGIAALAYRFARKHVHDPRFAFGTGKLGELAAFTSAIILAMIALYIGIESAGRLLHPVAIGFSEAIPIAVVGLGVNVASVWLLHEGGDHHHHHHDGHGHHHAHHDHPHHDHARHDHAHHDHVGRDTNFRAAYVHVLADALTSVLAIVALLGGKYFGLAALDPLMGLAGTLVIAAWAVGLIKSAGAVLLDLAADGATAEAIKARLERDGDRITDLHLWQVGPGHQAAIVSLVSDRPQAPSSYKARLADLRDLSHVTIEIERCPDHPLARAA